MVSNPFCSTTTHSGQGIKFLPQTVTPFLNQIARVPPPHKRPISNGNLPPEQTKNAQHKTILKQVIVYILSFGREGGISQFRRVLLPKSHQQPPPLSPPVPRISFRSPLLSTNPLKSSCATPSLFLPPFRNKRCLLL